MPTDLTQQWEIALSNCAQEPIHIPEIVQFFGGLIVTDRALEYITHVSDNLSAILGQNDSWASPDMLGRSLRAVLSGELVHDLSNACGVPTVVAQRHRLGIYEIQEQTLDVCVHCSPTRTLIELEPVISNLDTHMPLVMRAKSMLEQSSSSEQLLSLAVEQLRETTGFDRVMAYRFLPDGAGEVVAEACSPRTNSYLGLRYPASDIPDMARTLFVRTGVRIVADIHATAVPILALDAAEAPLDMSLALIRGVSPIHSGYLENMGVRASMAIAITVNGQLWGLFALHHLQPKLISPDLRTVVELFRQLFSLQFQQILAEERFCDRKSTASTLDKLFATQSDPSTHRDWKNIIIQSSQALCQLLSAHGVAFISEQQLLKSHGETPPEPAILVLLNHYNGYAQTDIITTECLNHLDIQGIDTWGLTAGALCFSIPAEEPFYLVFFRNEIIRDVHWAGNPNDRILVEDDVAPRLHPRRSFEEYTEIVKERCSPWTSSDLNIALEIRTELIRLARVNVQDFQQRQQNLLVAELNHRVKNILALIRSIARQTEKSTSSLEEYTKTLERRIAALSAAHDLVTGYGLEWPNLRNLLAIELRPYLNDVKPQVSLTGPVIGLKASFVPTFVLVLHELTSNAAKYGALSVVSGSVMVSWHEFNGGIKLIWQESDGPPIVDPQRRGFGQDLIERAIPYEFEGEAVLHFLASGVKAEFWLPNSLIRWGQEQNGETSSTSTTSDSDTLAHTEQIKILVVEDSLLVAMEMENTLKKIGFDAVTSAPSVERAFNCLQQDCYQLCLLDIDLKKETSFEVAYFLLEQSIPFVFTSGYNSKHPIPESLKSVQLLKKPIDESSLKKLIYDLLN
ncbi:GAF domain-containing protein [Leptolyngbya cf. ectocarpi LEGE 11479]|uniref:histidine kinase n=1 Tax=Leptolyngbya cf. ectocarpi LEGE 11479 TaxID=1828722 RepID=A0A928X4A7_LEPEC|nr:HWE histidine kinase domain-containing protein [Leptolyngbya ectocarpi]MBE9066308.1 GAF domain-containing protein [Leptolyngbya cf. ectocarpi LEGE 11479]